MDVRRVFAKLTLTQLLGNLIGGLLTWFYFRFVDFTAPRATIAVLSGQPSCRRAPEASADSAVGRAGRGS